MAVVEANPSLFRIPDPPIPPPLKDLKERQIPKRPIPPPNILVREGGEWGPVSEMEKRPKRWSFMISILGFCFERGT